MNKQTATKVYLSKLTVRIGIQPLDMMRYDHCSPYTEADANKLHRIMTHTVKATEDYMVTFLRWSLTPGPPSERWASFSCEIISWEPTP